MPLSFAASPRVLFRVYLALFLVVVVVLTGPVLAAADTTTSLGDSGGEGAGPFGGLLQSPEANLFTGAMTQSIPLRIPPGRKSGTPDLKLVYSSSGGNSSLGFGWDLPLGSIERSTKNGVPRCQGNHTNEFVLMLQGGAQELLPYSGNTYRPKTDEAFLEATKNESANTWEVLDRSGLRYRFGTTPASRLWTGADTFRSTSPCAFTSVWALNQVEDPNGNRIDITYRSGFEFLHPDSISYGGNAASTEHPFRVRFVYETTPHPNPTTSYRRGVYELLDQLVERIVVEYRSGPGASYSNVRNYELNHDHEVTVTGCSDPYRALLCQVTSSLLPTQTFEYATSSFAMGLHKETPPAPSAANLRSADTGSDVKRSVMDLNADGYLDLVVATDGGESVWGWYRGSEDGITPGTNWWSIPPGDIRIERLRQQSSYSGGFSQTKKETVDVTGDGIPDFVVAEQTPWKLYEGQLGTPPATPGFAPDVPWSAPVVWARVDEKYNNDHNFRNWQRLVDFNADGRPDLLVASSTQWTVYLNTGTGFESTAIPSTEFSHAGPISEENKFDAIRRTTLDLFDFNGDGLPDLLQQTTGGINLYLNDGRSLTDGYFLDTPDGNDGTAIRVFDNSNNTGLTLVDFVDVNADGLPDRVYYAAGTSWSVQLNLGASLAAAIPWPGGPHGPIRDSRNDTGNTRTDVIDWNGDGFLDWVDAQSNNTWTVEFGTPNPSTGPWVRPGIMLKAHNGLRGLTEVRYEPSTRFDNTLLPFVAWVVTDIRRTDGLCATTATDPFAPAQNSCIGSGNEVVKGYTYSKGLFDGASREFRGFGQVVEENPTETANRRIIDFSQVDHTRGKILTDWLETFVFNSWQLLKGETFQWATQANGPRTQVYLAESRVEERDPPLFGTQCLLTRNEPPDEFGRVGATCSMSCGVPAQTLPKSCNTQNAGQVTTTTTWSNPSSGYAVRERPRNVVTKYVNAQSQLETLTTKTFFYDNQLEGFTTKGNVTSVRTDLVGGSPADHATVTTGYDGTFGNVTNAVDPRGAPSSSGYTGTPFQVYPSSETDRLGFVVQTQWALQHGEPTRVEGPNGDVTLHRYDALGRVDCEARQELGESLANCLAGGGFDRRREYRYTYASPSATTFEGKLSCVEIREREPANTANGYVSSRTCVDALGRKRYSTEERVLGSATAPQTVIVDQADYDAGARVSKVYSRYVGPATEAPTATVTTYNYELNGISGRFDPFGRPHIVTPPDGRATRTEYNGAWTHTYFPWPNGNKTSSQKDALGREITRILYEGFSSQKMRFDYTYDGLDRMLSVTVDQNLATKVIYTYDSFGNPRTVVDPDSGTWTTKYDKNGNPTYQNDPFAGQHAQWCYDALDRVTVRCLYANGDNEVSNTCPSDPSQHALRCTQTGGVVESAYIYDETLDCGGTGGRGRLTSVTDLTGEECTFYDRRGLVTRSDKTLFGKFSATQFLYDEADHLQSITYPDGWIASHTYKQDGQLHSVAGAVSSLQYDLFGRPTLIVRAKGTQDLYEYHGSAENFRLRRIEAKKPASGTVYLNLEYGYGALGKVETVTDHQHGTHPVLSDGATYEYDGLGRLEDVTWNSTSIAEEHFEYNSLGNIMQKGGSTFSYDAAKPHQATAWGPHSQITYDANGRRQQKGGNQQPDREKYTYDTLDRLTTVQVYAGGVLQDTAVYDYDYTGTRVSKTIDGTDRRRTFNRYFESQSGYKTLYFYAGDQLIASWVVPDQGIFSEVPPGTPIPREPWAPPLLPSPVVWGLGAFVFLLLVGPGRRPIRLGVAIPVARVLATTAVFLITASPLGCVLACGPPGGGGPDPVWRDYHGDHLGSTQVLTDINGNFVHHVRYQAYGEVRGPFNASGGIVQPDEMERWQFTGYESEQESKLQYAGARYYDPELAQFLTHDPATQFASPYAYGPWDPMNGTDPNGEFFDPATLLWLAWVFVANFARVYFETGDAGVALQHAARATATGGITAFFGSFVKLPDPGRSPGWPTSSSFQNQGVPAEEDPENKSPGDPPPIAAQQALQNAVDAAQGAGSPAEVSGSYQGGPALELAIEQLNKYNPPSIEFDREYQGFIFERANGKLGSTPGLATQCLGAVCGGTYNDALDLIPGDAAPIYHWHTHGRAPDTNPMAYRLFSQGDIEVINELGNINSLFRGGVVGTPSGRAYLLRPNVVPASPYDPPAVYRAQEYLGRIRR